MHIFNEIDVISDILLLNLDINISSYQILADRHCSNLRCMLQSFRKILTGPWFSKFSSSASENKRATAVFLCARIEICTFTLVLHIRANPKNICANKRIRQYFRNNPYVLNNDKEYVYLR